MEPPTLMGKQTKSRNGGLSKHIFGTNLFYPKAGTTSLTITEIVFFSNQLLPTQRAHLVSFASNYNLESKLLQL